MYAEVKTLEPLIQKALKAIAYHRADIEIVPQEQVSMSAPSGDGSRGVVVLVNLDTGKYDVHRGSWGGSNIFTKSVVDDAHETVPMPPNGVVIKGSTGHPRTYVRLYCHPGMTGRFLPSGDDDQLTREEQQAIYCHTAIKGGAYRRDEMRRRKVQESTVNSLVERGYLKRNRAGSVQITTKGRNARDRGVM